MSAGIAQKVAEYRKALAAFLVPALTALGVALADGAVSPAEWVGIAVAALGSSATVALVPNRTRVRLRASDVPHAQVTVDGAAIANTLSRMRRGRGGPLG